MCTTEQSLQEDFDTVKGELEGPKPHSVNDVCTHVDHKSDLESTHINGRTPEEWAAYLKVSIPSEPNAVLCNAAISEVNERLQIAYSYLIKAELSELDLDWIKKKEYRSSISSIVSDYKEQGVKAPAVSTIEALAEDEIKGTTATYLAAKARAAFWKRHVDSLKLTANLLERVSWNLHTENTILRGT